MKTTTLERNSYETIDPAIYEHPVTGRRLKVIERAVHRGVTLDIYRGYSVTSEGVISGHLHKITAGTLAIYKRIS